MPLGTGRGYIEPSALKAKCAISKPLPAAETITRISQIDFLKAYPTEMLHGSFFTAQKRTPTSQRRRSILAMPRNMHIPLFPEAMYSGITRTNSHFAVCRLELYPIGPILYIRRMCSDPFRHCIYHSVRITNTVCFNSKHFVAVESTAILRSTVGTLFTKSFSFSDMLQGSSRTINSYLCESL